MASRSATNRQQPSRNSPHPAPAPTTPMDQVQDPLSQVTLPSTEGPGSPMDPSSSFKTEVNDDRTSALVIPSSLTPPPSSQVRAAMNRRTVAFSQSQQTAPVSPPATVLNTLRDRDIASDYNPPSSDAVRDASPEQLRAMLQTCIAENQKLKMETAHHKLQYNLLSLQADEESKRATVEHDMVRREVDALRMAEHSRQAKREYASPSDALTTKYLDLRSSYEAVVEENDSLQKRVRVAKKVIQQKEEETIGLAEEREMLLNRIRENREHFQMLCSPGGIFHGAMTPRQNPTHLQQQQQQPQPARQAARVHGSESQHGLSMILQAMSQEDHNNSAPSTPAPPPRSAPHQTWKHSRNAQSMSSLPTTPINRPRGEHSSLLPSVDLLPHTEPRTMYTQQYFAPITPDRRHRRKSRESTISADESEPLAAAGARRGGAGKPTNASMHSRRGDDMADGDVLDSQASQAATDLLRRHPGQSFELVASSGESRDVSPIALPAKSNAAATAALAAAAPAPKPRSRLPDSSLSEKRRMSGLSDTEPVTTKSRRDQHASPTKKARTGADTRRVGLGIQYH